MVQSIDQHNAQMITKPELVTNNLTIKPSAWKIQDKGIVPFQFTKVEHDETNKLQSALISVADGIREKGLSETLGLCLLESIECPEGHQLVERTEVDPDMLIVEPIHNDKVDESKTLTTIYRFDGDAQQGCTTYTPMQTAKKKGQFVFQPDQFLTTSQIKAYFSRVTRERRTKGKDKHTTALTSADDEEQQLREVDASLVRMLHRANDNVTFIVSFIIFLINLKVSYFILLPRRVPNK
ncbi:unnamed protein product [Rotaria socialis]|uniref:Uncharacterized protein n=1 Tax=Rotaria socialis TaxID=392032 RepID=A0A820Y8T4_9BILA|nr:unnamed protein product [Rotaria socialis]CAF4544525.1 unnamed protein product [Rotaria socialis]